MLLHKGWLAAFGLAAFAAGQAIARAIVTNEIDKFLEMVNTM